MTIDALDHDWQAHPAPTAPEVDPTRLLARAGGTPTSSRPNRAARRVVEAALGRMNRHRLIVIEGDDRHDYGPGGELSATIEILDGRAWWAVATEGSIGLGRGYLEGWWHSEDPTTVIRVVAANLRPLDDLRNRVERVTGPVGDLVRRALPRRDRSGNREDIASHYDIGNDFFQLWLDETMTYSSAVFDDLTTPLAEASQAKYDRLLGKLGLTPDHHLLEIGTGWGGLALRATERFGSRVTTTTISAEQLAEARNRVEAAGVDDRVTLLDDDWRDLDGRYDRLASVEMIEAVDWRDYDRFFGTIEDRLAPDGLAGLQAICVPDRRYERVKNTEDYIRRFVFPGGFLPSIGAVSRSVSRSTHLQIVDVEDLTSHYAETLRRWRERFDQRLDEVRELGLDERFIRLWRFYLAYCEAGFAERHVTLVQLVLAGPEWRGSLDEPWLRQ